MDGVQADIHLANIANDHTGELNSKLTWKVNALASQLLVEKAIENGENCSYMVHPGVYMESRMNLKLQRTCRSYQYLITKN